MKHLVISLALTLAMACPAVYAEDAATAPSAEQSQTMESPKEQSKKHYKKKKHKKKCHGKKCHGKHKKQSVQERIDEETDLTNR